MSWNAPDAAARWAWLRDDARSDERVLEHVREENRFADAALADAPRDEIRAALERFAQLRTSTAPVPDGPYVYWSERPAGADYSRVCRRLEGGDVEVLLDPNALADGDHYDVGDVCVSDDHSRLAWTVDRDGSELFTLVVKDLASRELIASIDTSAGRWGGDIEFDARGECLYSTVLDEKMRPSMVVRIRISDLTVEPLIEEPDERSWLSLATSSDETAIVVTSESKEDTQCWLIDRMTDRPPVVVTPRTPGVRYWVDHVTGHVLVPGGVLAVVSIERAERVIAAAAAGQPVAQWPVLLSSQDSCLVQGVSPVSTDTLAVDVRVNGFARVGLLTRRGEELTFSLVQAPDPDALTVECSALPQWRDGMLRLTTNSYTQPERTWQRAVSADEWTLVHERPMPDEVALDAYRSGVTWVTSADGTHVPVSWFAPAHGPVVGVALYGYGAYGVSDDPALVSSWLPLADRGVVCAVAHVRGGGEFGEAWHSAGRDRVKENGFADFLAAAYGMREHFNTDRIVARGGSAGGLMVGASLNRDPDAFCGVVAEVPFVDCLATMSDPDLPLTITEYEEWGNPADPDAFAVISRYTPVLNVSDAPYPPVLATCGLHDPRVGYWEAAKWVAVLREANPQTLALLRTRDAGHAGASALGDYFDEVAETHAFTVAALTGTLPRRETLEAGALSVAD